MGRKVVSGVLGVCGGGGLGGEIVVSLEKWLDGKVGDLWDRAMRSGG